MYIFLSESGWREFFWVLESRCKKTGGILGGHGGKQIWEIYRYDFCNTGIVVSRGVIIQRGI